ncbi:MAG TPA: hypothetical protein PLH94_02080 [Fimbriimonadaceae bacterium]|nr:hypothetical protein [Fimbriimonadaceae bacterium]
MPSLTISRRDADDVKTRHIYVKVDGKTVGAIGYGETLHVLLEAGSHVIVFDNTWAWKKFEVEVREDEALRASVACLKAGLFALAAAILSTAPMKLRVDLAKAESA